MGGRNFYAAAAHFWLRPDVRDQRNRPVHQRQHDLPAIESHVPEDAQRRQGLITPGDQVIQLSSEERSVLVSRSFNLLTLLGDQVLEGRSRIGMHRDGGVAEQRFRPGRRDLNRFRFPRQGVEYLITNVPETSLHRFVENLVVANGGLQKRIPVDESFAAVD